MRRLLLVILAAGLMTSCAPAPGSRPITSGPCQEPWTDASAQCGTISVLENRDAKSGRSIEIAYVVLPRVAGAPDADPVVLLAGGPGQPSAGLAGIARLLEPIRQHRDLVLFDGRGTGASHPLDCPVDVTTRPADAFGHVFDRDVLGRCRAALEATSDLQQYTPARTAEDLDELRVARGYSRLLLWGASYGTHIALTYMQRFPEHVAAAVLDSVAPPGMSPYLSSATNVDRSIHAVFARCAQEPRCHQQFPALDEDLNKLTNELRRGPLPAIVATGSGVPISIKMTAGDFGYAMRGILYANAGNRDLPGMIHRAAELGDLSEFAQRYWQRAVSFTGDFSLGLHLAMICAEDMPQMTDADLERETSGTILGRYLADEYRQSCGVLGIPASPRTSLAPRRIPTLLVTGEFDPVTPPSFAEKTAETLPMSRVIVVPGAGHGVTPGCVRPAVMHVLTSATLEGLPPVCGV
jgi:pimeloyl-ACP methyl ester carboxylesterase